MPNYFGNFPQNFMQQYQPPQNNISVVTVQGEAGARVYPVAAGNTVLLIDFYTKKFWLKSTDTSDLPSRFSAFSFTEDKPPEQVQTGGFVSREEFQKFRADLITSLQSLIGENKNANAKLDEQPANVSAEVQRICDELSERREKSSANSSATA